MPDQAREFESALLHGLATMMSGLARQEAT
jgi:hypothetical protein